MALSDKERATLSAAAQLEREGRPVTCGLLARITGVTRQAEAGRISRLKGQGLWRWEHLERRGAGVTAWALERRVLALHQDEPGLLPGEIARRFGCQARTIERAVRRLKESGEWGATAPDPAGDAVDDLPFDGVSPAEAQVRARLVREESLRMIQVPWDESLFRRILAENTLLSVERARRVYHLATGGQAVQWEHARRIAFDVPEWAEQREVRKKLCSADKAALDEDAIAAQYAELARKRRGELPKPTPRSPDPDIDRWIREARRTWRKLREHRGKPYPNPKAPKEGTEAV